MRTPFERGTVDEEDGAGDAVDEGIGRARIGGGSSPDWSRASTVYHGRVRARARHDNDGF